MDVLKEIIFDSISALLLLGVFQGVFNKNFISKNKVRTAFLCVSFIIINYIGNLCVPHPFVPVFTAICSILYITCFTKINLFASSVIYSIYIIIILSSEFVVSIIEVCIFKINLTLLFTNNHYNIIFTAISKILQIIIVILIYKNRKTIKKYMLFKKEYSFISTEIVQIGIFSIFIYALQTSKLTESSFIFTNMSVFLFYFIICTIKIKYTIDMFKNFKIQNNYQIQEKQKKNMDEIIRIIQMEKHDFANHMSVISGLCALNKPDSLQKISEYINKISAHSNESFVYIDTGNNYLDSLLSIKKHSAMKDKIIFDVEINEPLSIIDIAEDEVISLVGNLVDNAFDVLKLKKDSESKEICVATFLRKDKFCIEVANNGDVIPHEYIDKIFDKGFSTKTKSKGERGYGLYITKQLVEKNNGKISVESNENETIFLVEFDIKKEKG